MREIDVKEITKAVFTLCTEVCIKLPKDTVTLLKNAKEKECNECGKANLETEILNAEIAEKENMPVCQDTGIVTVFVSIGRDVHVNGSITDAINDGVRKAYVPFRKSVLDPITRENTKDNTPAVIHYDIVEGDNVRLEIAPKGFGSENMSRLKMLKPSDGIDGIKSFVVETVKLADACPCPPVMVGVGIGGTMEKAAFMSKHALVKAKNSKDPELAELENDLLERINNLGIGAQGMGGNITALAVYIEKFPTHIAGLPVAVNIQCHCARHGEVIL